MQNEINLQFWIHNKEVMSCVQFQSLNHVVDQIEFNSLKLIDSCTAHIKPNLGKSNDKLMRCKMRNINRLRVKVLLFLNNVKTNTHFVSELVWIKCKNVITLRITKMLFGTLGLYTTKIVMYSASSETQGGCILIYNLMLINRDFEN